MIIRERKWGKEVYNDYGISFADLLEPCEIVGHDSKRIKKWEGHSIDFCRRCSRIRDVDVDLAARMKCLSDWYGGDGNCYECEDNCTNVNKITEDDICPKCEEQLIFNENKVIICPKCSKIGGDTSEYREMSSTYKNIIEKGLS